MKNLIIVVLLVSSLISSCKSQTEKKMDTVNEEEKEKVQTGDTVVTAIGELILPAPYATESVRNSNSMADWPDNTLPSAPEGFTVTKYADGFENPRWSYFSPNGDLFVPLVLK